MMGNIPSQFKNLKTKTGTFIRHVNYAINSLSYVTVFRLKDWTFASALLIFVINNVYAIVTGSFSENTFIINIT
jgi:hypothetical protein